MQILNILHDSSEVNLKLWLFVVANLAMVAMLPDSVVWKL